jgi:hypothetical protein
MRPSMAHPTEANPAQATPGQKLWKPPAYAVAVYPDSARYKGGFGVRSASSNNIYKVSFDISRMAWVCSCRGAIMHGRCKHLAAAGLKGWADADAATRTQARQLGFVP